ncbi:hypothetical protein PPL_07421 [Heterostelium album PN500]|uniref:Tc1-like transposase DDE domain-containing protein n=1 Tax=Heterostelium pallidum (strain ATCC 26659 / Pp 5 / PN500) TaxID=670386 RepID=D3BFX0_HETP5|nr:hypothetical protein PPL_07421 [Heterostelium album PN500]EFA79730.1 hypothetical protein PPL_07421 [Heterostelium album PN500]|eukprot:XP_020431851.1 hypothetical protein PPL_07421 [Heterostelium album PN500]
MSIDELIRQRIIEGSNRGCSKRRLASLFGISRSTVKRTIDRYNELGHLHDRSKIGRPRRVSDRTRRAMKRWVCQRECVSLSEIKNRLAATYGLNISLSRIGNILREEGLEYKSLSRKFDLTAKHAEIRLDFAMAHRNWTVEQWKQLVFSGEGFLSEIEGTLKQEQYTEILRDAYIQSLNYYEFARANYILAMDNCSIHKAKSVVNYMNRHKIKYLYLPDNSPDINIIDNVWAILKRRVKRRMAVEPLAKFEDVILEEWEMIGPDTIDELYQSLPRRMEEIINAKGWWTKY